MPPPPSYIDINTNPFSRTVTQAEFNGGTFGGAANEVWFRFVNTTRQALGMFTDHGGTFTPAMTAYQSDGSTAIRNTNNITRRFRAMWIDCIPGTYYIKIDKFGGGASDFDFTFHANTVPVDGFAVNIDASIINDDTAPFPASVYDGSGTLLGFLSAIPAGEVGAILPSGVALWYDAFGVKGAARTAALVDETLTYVLSVNLALTATQSLFCANGTDFYVMRGQDGVVSKVTAAGVPTIGIATIPIPGAGFVSGFGVNNAGTIAYWVDAITPSDSIHRHNLVTDTPMSDLYTVNSHGGFYALTPDGNPGEILTLADDSIVTFYVDGISNDSVLIHVSAAGALLHTVTFSGTVGGTYGAGRAISHMSRADNVSSTIRVWLLEEPNQKTGYLTTVTLATGTDVPIRTMDLFTAGAGRRGDASDIPVDWPSASESCSMVAFLAGGAPGPGIGSEIICLHASVHGTLALSGSYVRAIGRVVT